MRVAREGADDTEDDDEDDELDELDDDDEAAIRKRSSFASSATSLDTSTFGAHHLAHPPPPQAYDYARSYGHPSHHHSRTPSYSAVPRRYSAAAATPSYREVAPMRASTHGIELRKPHGDPVLLPWHTLREFLSIDRNTQALDSTEPVRRIAEALNSSSATTEREALLQLAALSTAPRPAHPPAASSSHLRHSMPARASPSFAASAAALLARSPSLPEPTLEAQASWPGPSSEHVSQQHRGRRGQTPPNYRGPPSQRRRESQASYLASLPNHPLPPPPPPPAPQSSYGYSFAAAPNAKNTATAVLGSDTAHNAYEKESHSPRTTTTAPFVSAAPTT